MDVRVSILVGVVLLVLLAGAVFAGVSSRDEDNDNSSSATATEDTPTETAVEVATPAEPEPSTAEPSTAESTAPEPAARPWLLAHRGVHQTYRVEGLNDQTCTAERIDPPVHRYLENTVASIDAAFAAGAAVVEIDIAPTADDVLVVFHDWTVGCRTEGSGAVRDLDWAEVSALDIGYGYTSDGVTFPFRGEGVGLMPSLEEVFDAFPGGRFLINFKSNDVAEATLLHELVERVGAQDQVWAVYGAHDAVAEYLVLADARGFSEQTVTDCLLEFAQLGFPEEPPTSCRNTILTVPINVAPALPRWPTQLPEQLAAYNTDLVIVASDLRGIDTVEAFEELPEGLNAYVWTDRIDLLGS